MNKDATKIRLQVVNKSISTLQVSKKIHQNHDRDKTTSGNANGKAVIIDRLGLPEILSTIAADDTLVTIIDTDENRKRIENEFVNILEKEGNLYGKRKGNFSL